MNLRLAYHVTSQPPTVQTHSRSLKDEAIRKARADFRIITTKPKIILDNVFAHYQSREGKWQPNDAPNWTPPFDEFFVEWNANYDKVGHFGLVVRSHMFADGGCDEAWRKKVHAPDGAISEDVASQARWALRCSVWCSLPNSRPNEGAHFDDAVHYILVNREGQAIGNFSFTEGASENRPLKLHQGWLMVLGLGISFFHCKNVTKSETPEFLGMRWHRKHKVPTFKFIRLNIDSELARMAIPAS